MQNCLVSAPTGERGSARSLLLFGSTIALASITCLAIVVAAPSTGAGELSDHSNASNRVLPGSTAVDAICADVYLVHHGLWGDSTTAFAKCVEYYSGRVTTGQNVFLP